MIYKKENNSLCICFIYNLTLFSFKDLTRLFIWRMVQLNTVENSYYLVGQTFSTAPIINHF